MGRGVNKVIIVGNLGQDPEVRFMQNGNAVANFTVATSESWKDKQTGEQKEKTEWHRIVIYQRLAEIAGEYLKKGSKVYLEGKLQTRKWQNQQGADQYTTEILCNEMQMLDSKQQGQAPQQQRQQQQGGFQQQQPQPQRQQQRQQQQGLQQQQHQQQPQQQGGFNTGNVSGFNQAPPQQQTPKVNPQEPIMDFDDDIPF